MPNVAEILIRSRADTNGTREAIRSLAQMQAAAGASAREQQSFAQAQIKAARQSREYSTALDLIQRELEQTERGTARYINLLNQQIRVQDQAARAAERAAKSGGSGLGPALPRTVESFGQGAIQQLGGIAAGFGVAQVAMQAFASGLAALAKANSLEKTQATVRALAGSTERYQEVLDLARQGQQQFGGTLEENLRGLGGLVNTANRAGVSLQQLDDISRRLAVVDPTQGIEGAAVSLKAFISSGEITSLAERFEIPRASLRELGKEGVTTAERLQGLDTLLTQMGVSTATVTAGANTMAGDFDRLGSAASNASDRVGRLIAIATSPAARGLTNLLNFGSGNTQALQQQADIALQLSANYDDYAQKLAQVDTANRGVIGSYQALTEGQYAYRQSLIDTGAAADEATRKAQNLGGIADSLGRVGGEAGTALQALTPIILSVADDSTLAATQVRNLIVQFLATGDLDAFTQALYELDAAQNAVALNSGNAATQQQAANEARQSGTTIIADYVANLQSEAEKALIAEAATKGLADRKAELNAQALSAANALLASGDASLAAQQRMANATGVALGLIQAYLGLANAARQAAQAQAYQSGFQDYRAGERGTARSAVAETNFLKERDKASKEQAAAQRAAILATGTYAQKLALLTREKNAAAKGSAAYIRAETEIKQLQQANAKAGRSSASNGATAAARAAEQQREASNALLKDEERLIALRKQLAAVKDPNSAQALEIRREIQQVEARIAKNRERAAKAAETANRKDETAAQRAAEALEKSRDDLRSDEEKLVDRRAKLARATDETTRNELTREILDLEKQISAEREKQVAAVKRAQRAAIDARQLEIENIRQTQDEEVKLRQARAVLENDQADPLQKERARLRIEEIMLDRQERALEIEEKRAEASAATAQNAQATADALAEANRVQGGMNKNVPKPIGDGAVSPIPNTRPTPLTAADVAAAIARQSPTALPTTPTAPPPPVAAQPITPSTAADLGTAVRDAINGATLLLQQADGTVTAGVLQVAINRLAAGKR